MTATRWGDADLAATVEDLRRSAAHADAPARVEVAVMAAWDRAHTGPATVHRYGWRQVVAIAAAVTLTVALGTLGRELQRTTRASNEPTAGSGTLLLVGEPILQGEPVRVVRMRLPSSTLTELGVRPATAGGAHVDVDVIVGEDGVARAIRVGM